MKYQEPRTRPPGGAPWLSRLSVNLCFFESIQARDICAIEAPVSFERFPTLLCISWSASEEAEKNLFPISSFAVRWVFVSHGLARRPLSSGLQGVTAIFWSRTAEAFPALLPCISSCKGSASKRTLTSRAFPRYIGLSRAARHMAQKEFYKNFFP